MKVKLNNPTGYSGLEVNLTLCRKMHVDHGKYSLVLLLPAIIQLLLLSYRGDDSLNLKENWRALD
jgi:hypothetical protein